MPPACKPPHLPLGWGMDLSRLTRLVLIIPALAVTAFGVAHADTPAVPQANLAVDYKDNPTVQRGTRWGNWYPVSATTYVSAASPVSGSVNEGSRSVAKWMKYCVSPGLTSSGGTCPMLSRPNGTSSFNFAATVTDGSSYEPWRTCGYMDVSSTAPYVGLYNPGSATCGATVTWESLPDQRN